MIVIAAACMHSTLIICCNFCYENNFGLLYSLLARKLYVKVATISNYTIDLKIVLVLFVPHSWVSGLTQQAIAQLIGDPRYLRFNVLIREDAKGSPFTDVNAKAAFSPQLF